jgi:hypothetical protein
MMRCPSGENPTLSTRSACPRSTRICWRLAASHMRAVLSSEAVATRCPSGEKVALCTVFRCPLSTRSCCPLSSPPA